MWTNSFNEQRQEWFSEAGMVCKKECTRSGGIAEILGLSQGKVDSILFSCFDELTSLQVSSPFSRVCALWTHCLLILFLR